MRTWRFDRFVTSSGQAQVGVVLAVGAAKEAAGCDVVHFRCPGCRETLPVSTFGIDRSRADGRTRSCRRCRNDTVRRRYAQHKEWDERLAAYFADPCELFDASPAFDEFDPYLIGEP